MSGRKTKSYRDLIVWQKSILLVKEIYILTDNFPDDERFGLTSQMRRSAISIPSNIAEGRYRGTRKDYTNFLRIAYASGAELETQKIIAKMLPKTCHLYYSSIDSLLEEVMKMLNTMINKLKAITY